MRVSKSLVAKIGAVVATATVALSGAAAAANAAPATHAKVTTALSITNTAPKAHRHITTSVISGQLTAPNDNNAPIRGKWVLLQRQGPKGHWFAVKAERTNRKGRVHFLVGVRKRTVNFRLVFRGRLNFAKSVSGTVAIAPVATA